MVIVQHFSGSVKQYAEAVPFPGRSFTIPDTCPHPDCQASGCLIRWGTYERSARTDDVDYRILVQRMRCQACGHTHSLLPDFLHPHRHYVIRLLQRAVSLYLIAGLGWERLMNRLPPPGPARSTVREWIASFAYGAGHLLLDRLIRQLLALDPLAELPDTGAPSHLDRVSDSVKRLRLERAHLFWLLAEHLYAQLKLRSPRLHFAAGQLLPFLLHWLQSQALPPRLPRPSEPPSGSPGSFSQCGRSASPGRSGSNCPHQHTFALRPPPLPAILISTSLQEALYVPRSTYRDRSLSLHPDPAPRPRRVPARRQR